MSTPVDVDQTAEVIVWHAWTGTACRCGTWAPAVPVFPEPKRSPLEQYARHLAEQIALAHDTDTPDRLPVRVLASGLTGRVYALTAYEQTGEQIIAEEKHDVTTEVNVLRSEAWRRGWTDHETAQPGEDVTDPYAPTPAVGP